MQFAALERDLERDRAAAAAAAVAVGTSHAAARRLRPTHRSVSSNDDGDERRNIRAGA